MSNKTCRECKHFEIDEIAASCEKHYIICDDDAPACEHFKARVITNGDKIIAGGNEALVEYRQKFICHICAYRFDKKCNGARCKDGLIEWLEQEAEGE